MTSPEITLLSGYTRKHLKSIDGVPYPRRQLAKAMAQHLNSVGLGNFASTITQTKALVATVNDRQKRKSIKHKILQFQLKQRITKPGWFGYDPKTSQIVYVPHGTTESTQHLQPISNQPFIEPSSPTTDPICLTSESRNTFDQAKARWGELVRQQPELKGGHMRWNPRHRRFELIPPNSRFYQTAARNFIALPAQVLDKLV
jgi:hypothetical protein